MNSLCFDEYAFIENESSSQQEETHKVKSEDLYYNNFSKYALNCDTPNNQVDIYYYFKWKINANQIERISLQTLKNTLRYNKCRVSGNKSTLIRRLHEHYTLVTRVIHIQRVFRGFLVRECERMRGPASKDYSLCNNTTDFQTMELLSFLPRERFFSYCDVSGFIYGFDIFSLITMFKCKRKLINPYNREEMPFHVTQSLFSIYKKTILLYPDFLSEKDGEVIDVPARIESTNTRDREDDYLMTENMPVLSSPTFSANEEPDDYVIKDIRESCLHVFERIRNLVNGEVNPEWFLQLTKHECDRFYHFYYIWWTRSSTLSEYTKTAICELPNPFSALNRIDENSTEDFYKSICLDVIEAMVYTGVDEYHCSLGAKQVLTILTVVSRPTRRVWQELFNDLS